MELPEKYPQMVRIRNEGDSVFQARYAGNRYNLAPGAETIIPWEACCLWFGHPYAVDVPGDKRKRYRTDELKRLYVKYGVYERHDEAGAKFPKVHVTNLADNERILTVVDDPEGKNLNPAAITQADNEGLQAQLKAMQEQMVIMQAQLAQQQAENGGVPGMPTEATDERSARPEIKSNDDSDDGAVDELDTVPADTPNRPKAVAQS